MDIDQKIKELKKNVANQSECTVDENDGGSVCVPDPDGSRDHHDPIVNLLEEDRGFLGMEKPEQSSDQSLRKDQFARELKQSVSMVGTHILVSTGVSYALAWGVGYLFTLSSFWRIIMGALLAFAVNGLTVYRMIKQ